MLRVLVVILMACAALLQSQWALAESRVALVIGNSAYAHTTQLANPLNDASDVAAALKRSGFDVVEAVDASKQAMDLAVRTFTNKLAKADVALFFYAGHGLQVGAQNFLVPIDARLERERDLEFEAVKLDFVMRQMEIDREGKVSIVILDACRDNPLSRNLARSMGTRSTAIGRGLAAATTGLGTFIAYSTQPGNVALDGDGRNSPFTSALVKQMSVSGRNLPATMIEVRKDVVAATNGRQVPWDHSALTGDFYFVPGSGGATATTAAAPSPAAANAEVAALQERLRKLEEEAKKRETSATSPAAAADVMKLAELRARAGSLEEMTKDLQRKLTASQIAGARAADKDERAKHSRDTVNIMTEMGRRRVDLQRLKDEMAALEGNRPASGAAQVATSSLPVIPKATPQKESPNFDVVENVGLLGVEIRSFRAPNPIACREACENEPTCAGFQHGRKVPVMGNCELFSRIDARREDNQWFSGLRKTGAASAAAKIVFPAPVARTKQGFHFYEGVSIEGSEIKSTSVDSADGCMTVCRNTDGCVAGVLARPAADANCVVLRDVSAAKAASGVTAIVRAEP